MLWFFALTVALLANHAQGTVDWGQAVTAKAVVHMTGAEVAQLAGIVEMTIDKAGLPCMEHAKATITFGLMMPRITMSPAAIIAEVVGATAVPVPVAVQSKIPHIVARIVRKVIAPIHDMPDMKPIIAAGGVVAAIVDQLVKDIAVPKVVVTGNDVIARVNKIIGIVKGKACDHLITVAQFKTFVARVEAVLDGGVGVAVKQEVIAEIVPIIVGVVNDAVVARQVAVNVVAAAEIAVKDIKAKTVAMAAAFPAKIPVAIVLNALIKMAAGPVPGVVPGFHVVVPVIHFPAITDACYQQKLAIYNAVMLWVVADIHKAVINGAVGKILAGKVMAEPLIPHVGLQEGFKQNGLTNVLGFVHDKSHWLTVTVMNLKAAGHLDVAAAAAPLNQVLMAANAHAICDVDPNVLVAVAAGAYQKVAKIFDAGVMIAMEKKLIKVVDAYAVAEVVAKVAPVVAGFKAAFDAMHADFLVKKFSIAPVIKIVDLVADVPMAVIAAPGAINAGITAPVAVGAGIAAPLAIDAEMVIKAVLAEVKLTGAETLMTIPDIQLHLVLAKITAILEPHIPAACKKIVAIRVAKGLLVTIVKQRLMKTMEAAVFVIAQDVQPADVAIVKGAVMKAGIQWIEKFIAAIPAIGADGDVAAVAGVGDLLNVAGMEHMNIVEVLRALVGKAAKVVGAEVAICHHHDNIHTCKAFVQIFAKQLVKHSQEAVIVPGITAAAVGGDVMKVQQCKAIIGAVYGNMFAHLITAISGIADIAQPQIIRGVVIDFIIQHIRFVTFGAGGAGGAGGAAGAGSALINNPIFAKIVAKYSHISAGLLGGMTSVPVTGAALEQIIHQVVGHIIAAPRAGQDFVTKEMVAHLVAILNGAAMGGINEAVVVNTVMTIAQHTMKTVPASCRVPVMAKIMAAFLVLHTELVDTMPEHPLLAVLTPMIQAANPASPLPLAKAVKVLMTAVAQIKVAATKARAGLAIFHNVAAVKDVLAMVIAPVHAGETAIGRFQRVLPHLEMIINKPGVCEPIAVAAVIDEAKQYMTRMMAAPMLDSVQIGGVLAAVIADAGERKVVVDVIANRALPVVWAHFNQLIDLTGSAIHNPEMFPQFFTQLMVITLGLDKAPVERIIRSPIYAFILEVVKTELIAHLLPVSMVPAETVAIRLAEAFVRTMDMVKILMPGIAVAYPGMAAAYPGHPIMAAAQPINA